MYGYVLGQKYIVVSHDDGLTWKPVNDNHPFPLTPGASKIYIEDMAFDHVNRFLYIITKQMEVYQVNFLKINVSSGEWSDLTSNVPVDLLSNNVYTLKSCAVDPHFTNLIYLGAAGESFICTNSVSRSLDGGKTWEVISTNSEVSVTRNDYENGESHGDEVTVLRVNYTSGQVLRGTMCYGFWILSPPYDRAETKEKVTFHKIVFETNGGDHLSPVFIANRRYMPKIIPVKAQNKFIGWFTDESLTEIFDYNNTKICNSTKLYAKWEPAFSVTYMDGDNVVAVEYQETEEHLHPPNPQEHDGYTFAAYFYSKDATKDFNPFEKLTKNITVYAAYYKHVADAEKIKSSSFDYAGYIRDDYQIVFPTNNEDEWKCDIDAEVENRIVPFEAVKSPGTFVVSLEMDTKFRGGVTKSDYIGNYGSVVRDTFTDSLESYERTVGSTRTKIIHTQTDYNYILIQYYHDGSSLNWRTTRETIYLVEIESENLVFNI